MCSGLVLMRDSDEMPKKIVCYIMLMELWLDKHINMKEGEDAQTSAVGGINVAAESCGGISEYIFNFSVAS